MKSLIAAAVLVMLFAGCATLLPGHKDEYSGKVVNKYSDTKVEVEYQDIDYEADTGQNEETASRGTIVFYRSIIYRANRILVRIKNNGPEPVIVKWGKCSFIDGNEAHSVFVANRKYANSWQAVPDQTIPPKAHVFKAIASADSVEWSGSQWIIAGTEANQISAWLCIEVEKEERYYSVVANKLNHSTETEGTKSAK